MSACSPSHPFSLFRSVAPEAAADPLEDGDAADDGLSDSVADEDDDAALDVADAANAGDSDGGEAEDAGSKGGEEGVEGAANSDGKEDEPNVRTTTLETCCLVILAAVLASVHLALTLQCTGKASQGCCNSSGYHAEPLPCARKAVVCGGRFVMRCKSGLRCCVC